MTDQFSQEYVDYILSDEGKALQEGHFLEVGEWRIFEPMFKDDRPWLVTDSGEGYGLTSQGVYPDGSPCACMYTRERSRWLPTLWDLLQIIVGKIRPPENEVAEMASALEWIASEALMKAEPIMFAAAKLAVKALK